MQKLKLIGKPLLGEKYVEGKKKEERIMPSLVATTSALARTTCVHTQYFRNNFVYLFEVWVKHTKLIHCLIHF